MQAVLQQGRIEIKQQAGWQAAQSKIRQQLRLVNSYELANGLYLHNQLLLHDDIHAVASVQAMALEDNGQQHLTVIRDTTLVQLGAQTLLICRLQKTGAKMSMDLDSGTDHSPRDLVAFHIVHDYLCALCVLCGGSSTCRRSIAARD